MRNSERAIRAQANVLSNRFNFRNVGDAGSAYRGIGAVLILTCLLARPSMGQSGDQSTFDGQSSSEVGTGINSRIGFIGGQTVGRDDSIVHLELLPYVPLANDVLLLSDLRLFSSTRGRMGGNFGIGARRRQGDGDRVLGGFVWYDFDDTTGEQFQQITTSLEATGTNWDVFANGYFPVGTTRQRYGITAANSRFSGNRLLFDQTEDVADALTGFDLQAGMLLPGQFALQNRVKVFAGGYHYFGDTTESVSGFMGGLEGNLDDMIDAQVKLTSDGTYGTNVIAGISISLAGGFRNGRLSRKYEYDRLTQFANRSYNVVAPRHDVTSLGIGAINPESGTEYTIAHVSSTGTGPGSGRLTDPFTSIDDAQAFGSDIMLVHAGSRFIGDTIRLNDGDRLFGEGDGIVNELPVSEIGTLTLPTTGNGTLRPIFDAAGDGGIILASNTEVAGIRVPGNPDNGIFGDTVSNVLLRDIEITNPAFTGIHLKDPSGTIRLMDSQFEGSVVFAALQVDGGDADIISNSSFTGTGLEPVVRIDNTTGGSIDLSDATIEMDGNDVLLTNNAADITFGDLALTNSRLDIDGGSGDVTLAGKTTMINGRIDVSGTSGDLRFADVVATQPSFLPINLLDNTGTTTFDSLVIDTTGGRGLVANNAGTVRIASGSISTGQVPTAAGVAALSFAPEYTAIHIRDTTIDISLASVGVDGGSRGIDLFNTPGQLSITGDGSAVAGSGGVIKNTYDAGVNVQQAGTVTLRYLTLDNNTMAVYGSTVERLEIADSVISNARGLSTSLIDVIDAKITNSTFTDNGVSDTATISLTVFTDQNSDWVVQDNTFSGNTGSALSVVSNVESDLELLVENNVISTDHDATDSVRIDWNGESEIEFKTNTFNVSGDSGQVVHLTTESSGARTIIDFADNTLLITGADTGGLRIVNNNASTNLIEGNTFQLTGAGTALDLTLATNSNTGLIGNWIDGGTRGVWFRSIAGTSNIQLDSNLIEFSNLAGVVDEGFVFGALSSDVTFFGSTNNIVRNAATPLTIPAGGKGAFLLNGVVEP